MTFLNDCFHIIIILGILLVFITVLFKIYWSFQPKQTTWSIPIIYSMEIPAGFFFIQSISI